MPRRRCYNWFRAYPVAVRGILVLTILEAACAFGYSVYIVAIVSSYETDSREEYFGAGFLSILAAALLLFVATAVQHGNSHELAAANLISLSLCLGPLLILFKQVRNDACHVTTARTIVLCPPIVLALHLRCVVRAAARPYRKGRSNCRGDSQCRLESAGCVCRDRRHLRHLLRHRVSGRAAGLRMETIPRACYSLQHYLMEPATLALAPVLALTLSS